MSTQLEAIDAAPVPSFFVAHHRALVIASRTMLVMLVIAAVVVLGLGVAALILGGEPGVDGWLRVVFGRVFGVVAVAMAAVLGIPAGIGLWAMAGATAEDAVPALGRTVRRVLPGLAVAVVVATALVALTNGRGPAILDLGLIALVALASLGLAGAVAFSPHRGRAIAAAVAFVIVAGGTGWILLRAFLAAAG